MSKYCAIGDSEGTVTLMQLCDSLYQGNKVEKDVMTQVFERESRRERNLEIAKRLAESKKPVAKATQAAEAKEKKVADQLMKVEESFFAKVGIDASEADANVA